MVGRKIYVSNLQKAFTESRLEDIDLCKTQPWKHFVYMDQGNPSQECEEWTTQTAISDYNHLAHNNNNNNNTLFHPIIYKK